MNEKLDKTIEWLKTQIQITNDKETHISLSVSAKNGNILSINTYQVLVEDEENGEGI